MAKYVSECGHNFLRANGEGELRVDAGDSFDGELVDKNSLQAEIDDGKVAYHVVVVQDGGSS